MDVLKRADADLAAQAPLEPSKPSRPATLVVLMMSLYSALRIRFDCYHFYKCLSEHSSTLGTNMKKLIALALMTASVASQAGIIADTPSGWFVSADQKNGITFGDGDFSKKQSFTVYQGEILVGGKCNLKDKNSCSSFSGAAKPVAPGIYKYASKTCKLTIKEEARDVVITDVEGCGKDGYKLSNIYLPVGM